MYSEVKEQLQQHGVQPHVTRGSAKDQVGKELFCSMGVCAVFSAEPGAQFSLAMAH